MNKPTAIICDLDGTLCNIDHRLEHITKGNKRWKMFYSLANLDAPNRWCLELIQRHAWYTMPFTKVIYLTGRPEEYAELTKSWLMRFKCPKGDLIMRKTGDYRKAPIVKEEIYLKRIKPFYEVTFCIDDNQGVIDMWKENGLIALKC